MVYEREKIVRDLLSVLGVGSGERNRAAARPVVKVRIGDLFDTECRAAQGSDLECFDSLRGRCMHCLCSEGSERCGRSRVTEPHGQGVLDKKTRLRSEAGKARLAERYTDTNRNKRRSKLSTKSEETKDLVLRRGMGKICVQAFAKLASPSCPRIDRPRSQRFEWVDGVGASRRSPTESLFATNCQGSNKAASGCSIVRRDQSAGGRVVGPQSGTSISTQPATVDQSCQPEA